MLLDMVWVQIVNGITKLNETLVYNENSKDCTHNFVAINKHLIQV